MKQEKYLAKVTEKEINSKGFSLEQNYPNPFNPTTRINYTLPQNSYVTIKIYNMLGQEIKTLVQSEMSAGVHAVEWKGDSNNGNVIASGIYIYRLTADKYIISKKMLYLK